MFVQEDDGNHIGVFRTSLNQVAVLLLVMDLCFPKDLLGTDSFFLVKPLKNRNHQLLSSPVALACESN